MFFPDGYSLLGGGFNIHYHPNKGNLMHPASFPESSISWRAHSTDAQVSDPSVLYKDAAGIKQTLLRRTKPGITFIFAPLLPRSKVLSLVRNLILLGTANVLPGYALCGGGAHVDHTFGVGNFFSI